MFAKNILLILLTIFISVGAQTLLKTAMNQIGVINAVSLSTLLPLILKMVLKWQIIVGLSMYVIGTFFWLVLLSRADISWLYPFGALQYALIFFVGWIFLGERIVPARIVGVVLIMIGVFILSKWGGGQ